MTDVLGFITQCEACGQRCITSTQHGRGWTCPLCNPHVSGFGDCDIAAAEPVAIALAEDDDTELLRRIQG